MGLFSFLSDLVEDAKDWVEEKVEDAKDWVEEKVEDAVDMARDGLSAVLDFIAPVSSEKSYDSSASDIYTTERLNTILREFTEKYVKNAAVIEKACVREVEDYYRRLMPMVESSQEFGCSKSAIRRIKNNTEEMKKSINGSIEKPLRKRLSLDDRECLEILKMDAGSEKKNKMDSFVKKVINEAQTNLANEVKKSLDMQIKDIEEALREMEEKKEKEYRNLMEAFKRFSNSSATDVGTREKECVLPLTVLMTSEEVLKLLV